jgi:hypothetical protein
MVLSFQQAEMYKTRWAQPFRTRTPRFSVALGEFWHVLTRPTIRLICRYFIRYLALACSLRASLYPPGCSTVAVDPFEQTRMADLLITSDN